MATMVRVVVLAAAVANCGSFPPADSHTQTAAQTNEPVQAIYSDDLTDPWNRLFSAMFTRTVRHRKTAEYSDAGPFTALGPNDFRQYPVSTRVFDRLEDGDRAILPFYPSFIHMEGMTPAITSERLAAFESLLIPALADVRPRTPIDRVLMQADLWAVFDRLGPLNPWLPSRQRGLPEIERVTPLLARMIAKLALSRAEIEALPNHYALAQRSLALPDLFSTESAWHEIVWFDRRTHDEDTSFRQATRVFLRLSSTVTDAGSVLNDLRGLGHNMGQRDDQPAVRARAQAALAKVEAVALVMQLLALDTAGEIVPTPLIYSVQTRDFRFAERQISIERELSRRLLRELPETGGFKTFSDADPGYIPSPGNDYGFASPHIGTVREPILGRLATRCSSCHGPRVATFNVLYGGAAPPVSLLPQPNDVRVRFVAEKKKAREDYKRLRALWK